MTDRQSALDALQAGMDALFSTGVAPTTPVSSSAR